MAAARPHVLKLLGTAAGRTFGALSVLLPLALLIGGVGRVVCWQLAVLLVDPAGTPSGLGGMQGNGMIAYILTETGLQLVWGILFYPIIDAATIWVWRRRDAGSDISLYGAVNWALSRYKRMFLPHMIAFLTIMIGAQLIVPGILFGLQYAFVDAIAAVDERAKKPLSRSARLTKGRRGRIFWAWIPYMLWYIPSALVVVFWAEGQGWWAVLGHGTLDIILLCIMEMAMFAIYQERIEDALAARERKAAQAAEE